MLLKRVEIQGFKSFPDRVVLELGPGVTCIVGPNGTGKSNLADAIRWVLGEGNPRLLRGQRMEDMIFAGCQTRRAVSMAEVTLTFDNSDGVLPVEYAEVTLARRLYRDGSGEYSINRVPCRLKDVQDLLLDTGVTRNGYALVGQGKVDEILSARPEERRLLLEEAAGIMRAKSRKREALVRLEASGADIQRVADVMAELETQMAPLATEAERAAQWSAYRQERDALVTLLTWREWQRLHAQLRARREQNKRLQGQVSSLREKLGASEEQWAQLKAEQEDWQQRSQLWQAELMEVSRREAEAGREYSRLEEKRNALSAERLRLEKDRTNLRQELEAARAGAAEALCALTSWQSEHGTEGDRLKQKEAELAVLEETCREVRARAESCQGELIDLLGSLATARNRAASLLAQRQALEQGLQKSGERGRDWQGRLAALGRELEELGERREGLRRQLQEVQAQLASGREQAAGSQEKQVRVHEELRQLEGEYREKASRLQVLRELAESYEGFGRGPRAVLQARRERPGLLAGVVGAVSEVVGVPEHLETAVEAALGAALQDVVVNTAADAQKAIGYLKATQSGWATFLPLDTLRPVPLSASERMHLGRPGIVGLASDLVTFLPEHRSAVEFLLGRTVIAKDLPSALNFARLTGFRVKVVTEQGEVVFPGGSMAGGYRRGPRMGVLERSRQLSQLIQQVEILGQQLAARREVAAAAGAEVRNCAEKVARLSEEGRGLEVLLAQLEREDEARRAELSRLQEDARSLDGELELTRGNLARCLEEYDRVQSEVGELEKRQQELKAAVESSVADQVCAEEKRRRTEQEVTALKVALAGHEETARRLEETVRQAEERLGALQGREVALAGELSLKDKQCKEAESMLVRWEAEGQAIKAKRQTLEAHVQEAVKEGQNLSRRLAGLEKQQRQLRSLLAQAEEELHAGQVEEARLVVQVEEVRRRLAAGKAVTDAVPAGAVPDAAVPGALDGETMDLRWQEWEGKPDRELEVRVEELAGLMAALEPVNPAAPREYARLQERHNFLAEQRRDLEEGRNKLEKVVAQLDREMAEQFSRALGDVRKRFQDTFTEMFGGGRADLVLTDPTEPLTAGIEILAQPPGKKLQHLSLLSGGERTLCAIALLFALLQTRPSHFCLFDEIDASLDETNVDRFARYLKDLSRRGQFLLVTHQKGTMEVADVLYGTSMEESGVTRLVSVRLADVVEEAEG